MTLSLVGWVVIGIAVTPWVIMGALIAWIWVCWALARGVRDANEAIGGALLAAAKRMLTS